MVISADTSFLFSLYGNDSNTPAAVTWGKENAFPISISPLNRFELLNALRFSEFRRTLKPGESTMHQELFHNAITAGRLINAPVKLEEILTEAHRLSAAHTPTGSHRGFDILHVAAAKILHATHFLTFDANQRKLAESEGLVVPL